MARSRGRRGDPERSLVDDRGREFVKVRHRFPANATGFLIAPVLWMIYFVTIYSVQGAGCAAGLDTVRVAGTDLLRLVLGAVTAAVALGIAASGVASFVAWRALLRELDDAKSHVHGQATFLAYGALLHAGLFLVATLWSGIAVFFIDACDNLGNV